MKNSVQVVLALAGIIGILVFLFFFPWGKFLTAPSTPVETKTADSRTLSEYRLVDDDTILGDHQAPILIAEFGDFMCPFCGEVHRTIEPLWRKDYIETGKARYVFRDFISPNHQQAFVAAEANECAGAQGKQWPMYDILYDHAYNGDAWSKFPDEKSVVEVMKRYAAQIGLDSQQFETCMANDDFVNEVQQDIMAGIKKGVTGTPTIYIGNDQTGFVTIRGAQPYAVYKQIIDEKLKK